MHELMEKSGGEDTYETTDQLDLKELLNQEPPRRDLNLISGINVERETRDTLRNTLKAICNYEAESNI